MAKEWVDHSLDVARKVEKGQEVAKKARAEEDKKLKETLTQLSEVEKAQRNAQFALKGYERQAADALESQRKAENNMALTMLELKQLNKQLEAKEAEKTQAKQAAYDAGMTKAAESLTAQLRDVACAFCLEVWGQALNAARIHPESKLRVLDKVYYPSALRLAPTLPQPPTDPSPALPSSSEQKNLVPSPTSSKGKETTKELPPPNVVVDVEVEEEVAEQAIVYIVPLLLLLCTTILICIMKKV